MTRKTIFYLLMAAAVGAVLLAYSNHFHNGFHFDDSHSIQGNIYIRDLRNIPSFFLDPTKASSLPTHYGYRPLLTVLNAISYHMGNGDPLYFQILSFSFYLLVCAAYYFMLRYIFNLAMPSPQNDLIALIVMIFYSVHVVNAETVNYISARSDLLSALMVIAALCIYMYRKGKSFFRMYLVFLFLGGLIKQIIGIFPLILFFYIVLFEQGLSLPGIFERKNLTAVKKAVLDIIPSCIVCGGMQLLSSHMKTETIVVSNLTRWEYVLTQPAALFHYFVSFFIPSGLCADIEFQGMSGLFDERVVIGCIFIAVMLAWAVKTSKNTNERPIAFGILWFFITSLPTSSGVVALAEAINDHRMFTPLPGLMMAIGWSIKLFLDRYQEKIRRDNILKFSILITLLLILAGHIYGTHQRNKVWKNDEALWRDVTIKRPANGRGLMNYGLALMGRGDYNGALYYYERALFYCPNYVPLHVNIGIVKDAMGDPVRAEDYFRKAMDLDRSSPTSYFYYARYLNARNRRAEAIPLLETCIKLSPGHADCNQLLKSIRNTSGNK